jgi:Zn finger protein HypA/HybF involved in hydrogenase expression
VVLGPFSGVDEECLRFYLTELCRGTPAQGAELTVRSQPVRLTCQSCGHATFCERASSLEFSCSECGGPYSVEAGHELYLDSVEVTES